MQGMPQWWDLVRLVAGKKKQAEDYHVNELEPGPIAVHSIAPSGQRLWLVLWWMYFCGDNTGL